MARTLTPRDAHALVNLISAELTGQDANLTKVTTDNFVSVGETIMSYSAENVYNAISIVMLRTLIAARPTSLPLTLKRMQAAISSAQRQPFRLTAVQRRMRRL